MAKISARGAREVARFKGENGKEWVLTSDGRLLSKAFKGDGWGLLRRKVTVEIAVKAAELRGMVRT